MLRKICHAIVIQVLPLFCHLGPGPTECVCIGLELHLTMTLLCLAFLMVFDKQSRASFFV